MGLASQSSRSDRSSNPQRSRGLPRTVFAAAATLVAFGGAYQLLRSDAGDSEARGSVQGAGAATAATVSINEAIAREARRSALEEAFDIVAPIPSEAPAAAATTPQDEKPAPAAPPATPPAAEPPATTPDSTPPASTTPATAPETPAGEPSTPPAANPGFGNGFTGSRPTQEPASSPPSGTPEAMLKEGLDLAATEPVKARALLSQALLGGTLGPAESRQASDALQRLSALLFMTPVFNVNDTACFQYTVQSGDSLERIVRRNKLGCDWRLVARMNNIKRPEAIAVGKRLKLPRGPFSAVVSKRDYRIDLCTGIGSDRIVIASLPVGLGAADGTPVGRFRVKPGSKLINPEWTHPVTGQRYEADDPANPIGEHWLGLEGIEGKNASLLGYGIHGTIENDSIGQNMSLGCVRLLKDDVAVAWEALGDGSEVEIR